MNTTEQQTQQPETMDRRKKYYLSHRHTPEFKARISKAKKAHYQRNRDVIKAKALARYYEIKGVAPPTATTEVA
jgi:hypothetical protein